MLGSLQQFENGPKGGCHTTVHSAGHRSQVFIAMRFSELLLDAAKNSFTAVSFLAAAGLLVAPSSCPRCHKGWKLHCPTTRSQPYFWCWHRPQLRTSRGKRRCCNTKRTWHSYCPLAKRLPKMLPGLLLQVLYHFAQRCSIEIASFETDLHRNTVAAYYDALRLLVVQFMEQLSANFKLGGSGRVVCLDETHITRKKRTKSGWGGRTTGGQQTILLSGCFLVVSWMVSTMHTTNG